MSWVQVIGQMQEKLRLHCAPVQLPMGLEDQHTGLIDLIKMKAFHFKGPNGEDITEVIHSPPLQAWSLNASDGPTQNVRSLA